MHKVDNSILKKLFRDAITLHQSGDISGAEDKYLSVLTCQQDHPDALHNMGVICVQKNKKADALSYFRRALKANPAHPQYWITYVDALIVCGRPDAARHVLDQGIEKGLQGEKVDNLLSVIGNAEALMAAKETLLEIEKSGRFPEMEAEARRFIARHGEKAVLLQLLGVSLLHQNLDQEALCYLEKACASSELENDVTSWNQKGVALKRLKKYDEANQAYLHALQLRPDSVEVLANLGDNCHQAGDFEASRKWLEKALALDEKSIAARVNLANTLKCIGREKESSALLRSVIDDGHCGVEALTSYAANLAEEGDNEQALPFYRQALEKRPQHINALRGMGKALGQIGEIDKAIECYRAIQKADPDNALGNILLGNISRDQGEFDKAQSYYHKALDMDGNNVAAVAGLINCKKMEKDNNDLLLKALDLDKQELSDLKRALLSFAIGKYYNDLSEYNNAFLYYSKANDIRKYLNSDYNSGNTDQIIKALEKNYSKSELAQKISNASLSRKPVFILGLPRSGTSLTEQILASHPDIYGAGELYFWQKQAKKYKVKVLSNHYSSDMVSSIGNECLTLLNGYSLDAHRVVDKMPGNFMWIGLIHRVFPNAKILHTMRNPVDTCLSIYFQDFAPRHRYANDLDDLAGYYRQYHRIMAHWRSVLPSGTMLEVPYEALVEDQEGWSRRIIDFIGLDWEETCLEFYKTQRKVGTASNWQARQPIYKTSKERWRNYEAHVGPLLPLLNLYDPLRGQIEP